MTDSTPQPEPFPPLASGTPPGSTPGTPKTDRRPSDLSMRNRGASRSSFGGSIRRLSKQFEESSPPVGFMSQTGQFAASVFSLEETHRNHRAGSGGLAPGIPLAPIPSSNIPQPADVRSTSGQNASTVQRIETQDTERGPSPTSDATKHRHVNSEHTTVAEPVDDAALTEPFDNGYHFPPKYTKMEATKQFFVTSWNFISTFWGFFWFIYGLNVVAWGGMLFLLLCNASPAMCHPTCNDINSPRRVWIEYDSQILNALFCVTGFGLAPWRFRDLYYLLKYRVWKQEEAWRRLAALKRDWFRLEGSQDLPLDVNAGHIPESVPLSSIPLPAEKIPDSPLTGVRAAPTAPWKMDFFIWTMIWNTIFQAVLCGFMWGMNRYDRPSWSTGLFVALGCIIAAVGGYVSFLEGKRVKSIEGVPLTEQDKGRLARDKELGVSHYNNIKDKKPKEKVADEETNKEKPSKVKKALHMTSSE